MKHYLTILFILLFARPLLSAVPEIYNTRSAKISFFSSAPLEDIRSENPNVNCILNTKSGELAFKVIMTSFQFQKKAMQDHFNKDFVESHKYPESTFIGNIKDFSKIDLSKNGKHNVTVAGVLTIHGVTKNITQAGQLEVKDGSILLHSQFNILLSDYNVRVPSNYVKKISNTLQITISATLQAFVR
jgi:hypothetical protein